MQKSILLIFTLFSFCYSQDIKNSIYLGRGSGANIGGEYGLGFEYYISEYTSASIAVGYINRDIPVSSDAWNIDFDIGYKFYPVKFLSIGMNYGLINYFHTSIKENGEFIFNKFKKFHGISLNLGLKQKFSESISIHIIMSKRLGDESKTNPFNGRKSENMGLSLLLHYSI